MNNVTLVGRVATMKTTYENGKQKVVLTMAITSDRKNEHSIYETDFIPVLLHDMVARNAKEYLKTGDIVSVRGRLQNEYYIDKDDDCTSEKINVIGERLTFISSKRD